MSKITRKSILTGNENTMELPLTPLQVRDWLDGEESAYQLFPFLNAEQMEFLINGTTPEENAAVAAEVAAEVDEENAVEECELSYA